MDSRKHKTSILLPSAYRSARLELALESLFKTLDDNDVEILVSCVHDDADSLRVVQRYPINTIWLRERADYERGAIWAFNKLAELATGDVLADVDDDQIFHPGWLTNALRELDRLGGGVMAFNDLKSDGNDYAAHFIVSRDFLRQHMGGTLWPPMYKSWWCDRELSDKAKAAGLYAWAQDAIVEHNHWSFNLSEMDETYSAGKQYHDIDRELWQTRAAQGYPVIWQGVL